MYEWYERFFTDIEVFAVTLFFGCLGLLAIGVSVLITVLNSSLPTLPHIPSPPPPWTYKTKTEERKLMWIGRRAAPDRLVKLPGKDPVFVELKAPGGRLSRLQDLEHRRMRAVGLRVEVVWRVEDIEGVLT